MIRRLPFRGRPVRVLSSRMISSLFVARYGARVHALDIEDPWSRFHAIWRVPEAALLPALKRFGAGADVAVANGSRIARLAEAEFARGPVISLTNALDPVKLQVAGAQDRPRDYPAGRSVLFSGPVDGRIDFRLLQPAFERFTEVQFVFVGSVPPHWSAEAAAVDARYANVHFLGQRPIELLGAYLRQADLFMIPYCTDDAWTYVFPAKIYEYFAFGREVLGTFPIPDLPALLKSALHITPTAESFMAALRNPGPREDLAARAREETWGARADVLMKLLGLPGRDGVRRDPAQSAPWPREHPSVSVGEDLVQP